MFLRALLLLSMLVPISVAHAQDADAKRKLGMAGQALGKALATHDQDALEKLWSPQMIVNGPNNTVLTRAEIFEGMKNGQLDYETGYKTTIEKIEFFGNVAVTMSDETGIGRVKVLRKNEKDRVITRTDLAAWLVDQLESRIYVGQAVAMVNP